MMIIQPDNRPIGKVTYMLCQSFSFRDIIVPSGFINDGGSVPRWAWSISGLTPDGPGRAAWVIHDFLSRFGIGDRKDADELMRVLLIMGGVAPARARLAYMAVRVGGGRYWGKVTPPKHDDVDILKSRILEYKIGGVIDFDAYNYAIDMVEQFRKAA